MSEEKSTEKTPISKDKILIYTAIGIVVLVLVFVAAIELYDPEPEVPVETFQGFVFFKKADFWHFNWQRDAETTYTVSLRFHPREALEVELEGEILDTFNAFVDNNKEVYVTFNPQADNFTYTALAAGELSLSVARALDVTPIAACTVDDGTETCVGRPIVTCDDTDKAVIFLDDVEDETKITLEDNCLIISGRGMEKLRAVDRVLYHWYRVY